MSQTHCATLKPIQHQKFRPPPPVLTSPVAQKNCLKTHESNTRIGNHLTKDNFYRKSFNKRQLFISYEVFNITQYKLCKNPNHCPKASIY